MNVRIIFIALISSFVRLVGDLCSSFYNVA